MSQLRFVIVTGLSGAGKTQAIRSLEDLGFFCVDNLPPELIPKFAEICRQTEGKIGRVAVVMDIRGGQFFSGLQAALEALDTEKMPYQIIFLEADDETLVRRFKESRRSHPLALAGRILDGIKEERQMLDEIRGLAHNILDTSNLTASQLRRHLAELFQEDGPERFPLHLVTFGFKRGLPLDADLVFDVRFLPNPHYVEGLGHLPGINERIREYLFQWPITQEFLDKLMGLLEFLIPNYVREGKSQLVIAVGCTGGRHRSVVVGEYLAEVWRKKGYAATVEHRDLGRGEAE